VLRVIESEASRTLDEMRSMVRILRRDDEVAERAPTAGIEDLRRLARSDGSPIVDVRVQGDPTTVIPSIATAAFRIAQEAVTNARRHARNATRVDVSVDITPVEIRLEVHDDGDGPASVKTGYGVPGMVERAALLGGTCTAGPLATGGWTVTAVLPRSGRPA
jgi:signal transduction histidine kinase